MGRGAVGFDLTELGRGGSEELRAEAKGFVLRVLDLAVRRHRWDELGYEPPFAAQYLRRFREIVEAFEPPASAPPSDVLPEEGAIASCVRHRVLSALPYWDGCVFCHTWPGRPRVRR
ncbi:hypothetical protein ABZY09_00815 [Streptomyces sp. NPDC002928]|uniref:hypothetical protein n=1 Tax=Streptomyces sp. NPDC002928 TaxID=3154440 RepID=UPI0033B61D22